MLKITYGNAISICINDGISTVQCTPLCKSNGTFSSDMDINELTSVLHKYKTPVTNCCILTCC